MGRFLLLSVAVFLTLQFHLSTAFSQSYPVVDHYYGEDFFKKLEMAPDKSTWLKAELFQILSQIHMTHEGKPDEIVRHCPLDAQCFQHKKQYSYDYARHLVMDVLEPIPLFKIPDVLPDGFIPPLSARSGLDPNNRLPQPKTWGLWDPYCQKTWPISGNFQESFLSESSPTPEEEARSEQFPLNIEHVWPQHHFTSKFPHALQKTDLHHLFPSGRKINQERGSLPFGEVATPRDPLSCKESLRGWGKGNFSKIVFFQPPPQHRGNIARALFYFSIRYQIPIKPHEEFFLRKWHKEDPSNPWEIRRNHLIHKEQGNRNPFIDFPRLVELINDF